MPPRVERLLEAGRGTVRQVTLAPELPGGLEAIRLVVGGRRRRGRRATPDADADACARGLRRRRDDPDARVQRDAAACTTATPGPVGAAASDPTRDARGHRRRRAPATRRWCASPFAAAPGRIALVTDAMAAAGAGDGRYDLGSLAVEVVDGVARLAGGGAIAGSTLTQDAALRRVGGGRRAPVGRRRPR